MSSVKQTISLFIPHIFLNLGKDFVIEVLEDDYKLGKVSRVDFVEKTGADGKTYNAAYVHFEHWNQDSATAEFQEDLLNSGNGCRIVYDAPWFWIVLENKKKKYQTGERKPRLDLSETAEELHQAVAPVAPANYSWSFPELPIKYQKAIVPEQSLQELLHPREEFKWEEWEDCEYTEADYMQMNEFEDEIDGTLISIDARYVKAIEEEVGNLKGHLQQMMCENQRLQAALYAESAKSQALAKAVMILDSN